MLIMSSQEFIRGVVGLNILEALYLVHLFKGADATVIALKMIFTDGAHITVRCDSDGESIKVTQESLEQANLGAYGRIDFADITQFDPASLLGCLGSTLERAVIETKNDKLKSLRMEFNGCKIFFSNVGDVLNFDEVRFRQMITEDEWGILTTVTLPD